MYYDPKILFASQFPEYIIERFYPGFNFFCGRGKRKTVIEQFFDQHNFLNIKKIVSTRRTFFTFDRENKTFLLPVP